MFPPGSIVKRPLRNGWGLVYEHMGVCVAPGQILHFSGESKKEEAAALRLDTLAGFAAGELVELHASPVCAAHAEAIVAEALRLKAAEANGFNGQYSWLFNNCEDFCIACYEAAYASGSDPRGVENGV